MEWEVLEKCHFRMMRNKDTLVTVETKILIIIIIILFPLLPVFKSIEVFKNLRPKAQGGALIVTFMLHFIGLHRV